MKDFFRKISSFFKVSEEARMPHEGGGLSSAPGDDIPAPIEIGEPDLFADFDAEEASELQVDTASDRSHEITGVENEDLSEVDGGAMKSALESARQRLDQVALTPEQQKEMDQLDFSDVYTDDPSHATNILALIMVKELGITTEEGNLISTDGNKLLAYRMGMVDAMSTANPDGFKQLLKKVFVLTKGIDPSSPKGREPVQMGDKYMSAWEVEVPNEVQEMAANLSRPLDNYKVALADHRAGKGGIKVAMK